MSSNRAKLLLLVHPGAPTNEIVNFIDGTWQVRVAAPPVRGKANKELIAFLGRSLGVSKGSIIIASGLTSRRKALTVDGLSQDEVSRRLSLLVRPSSAGGGATSR